VENESCWCVYFVLITEPCVGSVGPDDRWCWLYLGSVTILLITYELCWIAKDWLLFTFCVSYQQSLFWKAYISLKL